MFGVADFFFSSVIILILWLMDLFLKGDMTFAGVV